MGEIERSFHLLLLFMLHLWNYVSQFILFFLLFSPHSVCSHTVEIDIFLIFFLKCMGSPYFSTEEWEALFFLILTIEMLHIPVFKAIWGSVETWIIYFFLVPRGQITMLEAVQYLASWNTFTEAKSKHGDQTMLSALDTGSVWLKHGELRQLGQHLCLGCFERA